MRPLLGLLHKNHRSLLLCLLFFLLPLQTRWIIHAGTLNNLYWEYGTISLYGTDILILAFIAVALTPLLRGVQSRSIFNPTNHKPQTTNYALVALILWSLLSILWSPDKLIAFYQSLKLLEGVLLFLAIRFTKLHDTRYKLQAAFIASAFLQAALGTWQFFIQNVSANKWLGMAWHDAGQSGAAVVETALRRWLRAYGTLPHPNILGEFLVVGLILYLGWLIATNPRWKEHALNASTTGRFIFWSLAVALGVWIPYAVLISGLFFTLSRAAWAVFFLGLTGSIIASSRILPLSSQAELASLDASRSGSRNLAFKSFLITIFIFAVLGSVYSDPMTVRITATGRLEAKSIAERLGGYTRAWGLIKQHPLLGTGIGQSSLMVSKELEKNIPADIRIRSLEAAAPVHNTPLLVVVELGFFGGLLYLVFWFSLLRAALRIVIPSQAEGSCPSDHELSTTVVLVALLLLTLADHSFWTLHAGQMLFWVIAGLALRRS